MASSANIAEDTTRIYDSVDNEIIRNSNSVFPIEGGS